MVNAISIVVSVNMDRDLHIVWKSQPFKPISILSVLSSGVSAVQHKREEIVLSGSLSYFYLLRMLFKTMKLLTLLVFFTQVRLTISVSKR